MGWPQLPVRQSVQVTNSVFSSVLILKGVHTAWLSQPDTVIYDFVMHDFSVHTALQVMYDFYHPCTLRQVTQYKERKYAVSIMDHNYYSNPISMLRPHSFLQFLNIQGNLGPRGHPPPNTAQYFLKVSGAENLIFGLFLGPRHFL